MVTVLGLGAEDGATYVAESATALPPLDCAVNTVSDPHADPLHPLPDNDHASTSLGFEPGTGVSVAMIADLRSHGRQRALPGKAQDGGWEMQLCASNEFRIHFEGDGDAMA